MEEIIGARGKQAVFAVVAPGGGPVGEPLPQMPRNRRPSALCGRGYTVGHGRRSTVGHGRGYTVGHGRGYTDGRSRRRKVFRGRNGGTETVAFHAAKIHIFCAATDALDCQPFAEVDPLAFRGGQLA